MHSTILIVCFAFLHHFGYGQSEQDAVAFGMAAQLVRDITPEQLEVMRNEQVVYIFDCNEADQHGWSHVPGSVLLVYDEVTEDKLPSDKTAILVFYCYSPECPAGAMAAKAAVALGHSNVYSMPAGIVGWEDAGLPTGP
ncbi:MAG: rhodanese-like domain-containing protein [Flavobacteriales bacterium]|nr:rhodanese-like domain-containing protein [Flavobacteriales bacterium]